MEAPPLPPTSPPLPQPRKNMELSRSAVILYWGGEYSESDDFVYTGGMKKLICIDSSMGFMDIINMVYEIVGYDRVFVKIKLFLRCPMNGRYMLVPLDDDNALTAMWLITSRIKAPAIELYVEEVKEVNNVEGDSGTTPVSKLSPTGQFGSSASLFSNPSSMSDHMAEFTSPAPSPQIVTQVHIPFTNQLSKTNLNEVDFVNDLNEGHVDSDPEEDERAREVADKAIRDGVPVQDWLKIDEVDQRLIDSWMPWKNNLSTTRNPDFEVGQEFDSLAQFKNVVKTWSISNNYNFRVLESDPTKYVIRCVHDCPWRLRAVITPASTFKIVKYVGPHTSTCGKKMSSEADHPLLSSEFVAKLIEEFIRADPSFKVYSIVCFVKDKFQSLITYKRAWMAKKKALSKIFGDCDRSFEELPRYLQALENSNEGTIVHWCTIPIENQSVEIFQRVFWAFRPSIEGFRHCRPLILIGATHLYDKYKGTLLIAMGTDANFELFPLAFAVVEGENNSSWSWFMDCIRRSITDREGLCVISNYHEDILLTMNKPRSGWEEPFAHHRLCVRDLASNLQMKFKNDVIKNLFCKAAGASQLRRFEYYMDQIRKLNIEAANYLFEIPLYQWSLHHDGGFRYGVKTNNMSEMFHVVLKGARYLPITPLVQMTFYRVNSYFVNRRETTRKRLEEGHLYSPKATAIIGGNMEKAGAHKVVVYNIEQEIYEVTTGRGDRLVGKGGKTHYVNLFARTCTCGKIRIFKLPCSHVLAVCRSRDLSYGEFVDSFFTAREYSLTYSRTFTPVPDMRNWDQYSGPKIIPDDSTKRTKGRPKSTEIISVMDGSVNCRKNKCSVCHQEGHNKRVCPNKDCGGASV